jgi:hypothetical protein
MRIWLGWCVWNRKLLKTAENERKRERDRERTENYISGTEI